MITVYKAIFVYEFKNNFLSCRVKNLVKCLQIYISKKKTTT